VRGLLDEDAASRQDTSIVSGILSQGRRLRHKVTGLLGIYARADILRISELEGVV
jgi:hypothetical protein